MSDPPLIPVDRTQKSHFWTFREEPKGETKKVIGRVITGNSTNFVALKNEDTREIPTSTGNVLKEGTNKGLIRYFLLATTPRQEQN